MVKFALNLCYCAVDQEKAIVQWKPAVLAHLLLPLILLLLLFLISLLLLSLLPLPCILGRASEKGTNPIGAPLGSSRVSSD